MQHPRSFFAKEIVKISSRRFDMLDKHKVGQARGGHGPLFIEFRIFR